MLTQSIKQFQCKKIFFAGCHDSGYMHDLTEYQGDDSAKARIILLETTPAHHSFRGLGYQIAQFDRIFRSLPLETVSKPVATPTPPAVIQSTSQDGNYLTSQGALSTYPPQRQPATGSESHISSGNGGHSITYATIGGANGQQNITLVKKARAPLTINCNAKGHRLDPLLKQFTNDQVIASSYSRKLDFIKPKGFCNEQYLLGKCPRSSSCKMDHDTVLTDQETAYHRNRARLSLCGYGPSCDRYGCYLSHHCPWDVCSYGKSCKFRSTKFGDLHYEKSKREIESVQPARF